MLSAVFTCFLLAPQAVQAAPQSFTVNDPGDAADPSPADGICDSDDTDGVVTCTLRAAIDSANGNANPSDVDQIGFSLATGTEITVATPLPISEPIAIDGCNGTAGATQPCIGVRSTASTKHDGFAVNASNVSIKGMSITGFQSGINQAFAKSNLTIRNNWIGLRLDGTSVEGNTEGVRVTGSGTTIGGPTSGDRNVFGGGSYGILSVSSSSGLTVENNHIGVNPAGTARLPIAGYVAAIQSSSTGTPTVFRDNTLAGGGAATCLTFTGSGALIEGNQIEAGLADEPAPGCQFGISVEEFPSLAADANTIKDNVVGDVDFAGVGIEIRSGDANVLTGNIVGTNLAGEVLGGPGPGVSIYDGSVDGSNPATGNVVGGDTAAEENLIANMGDGIDYDRAAIEILQRAAPAQGVDGNSILRNRGFSNPGGFVDLTGEFDGENTFPDGPDHNEATGPNDGIQQPVISGAGRNQALGTNARPGATVMVFLQGDEPTDVAAFLGSGVADSNGAWRANYAAPRSNGDLVRATQTDANGNTSELSDAASTDAVDPPQPSITDDPGALTNDRRPLFTFEQAAGGDGTSFSCALDSGIFGSCSGGASHRPPSPLPDGQHTFRVVSVDASGNTSTQATRTFSVDATPPAQPVITDGPAASTNDSTPTFTFSGEAQATSRCAVDSVTPVACDGGDFTSSQLADGQHTFRVTQTDQATNESPAATRTFTVDTVNPAAPQISGGPPANTNDATPSFAFNGEPGATFRCVVDSATPVACDSGSFTSEQLADGQHTFQVTQRDAATNESPGSIRSFNVDTVAPETAIDPRPAEGSVTTSKPDFGFSSPGNPGVGFRCRFDSQPFGRCSNVGSHVPATALTAGRHIFEVRAVDPAGNADPTPAQRSFRVGACGGRAATIVGNDHANILRGTRRADVILGLGSADLIKGLGGNDFLCGGGGADDIQGGPGKDALFGQGGPDRLLGGPGKDRLVGGPGTDRQRQ